MTVRTIVLVLCAALVGVCAAVQAAYADDALTIIAGSSGAGPYDALDLVAAGEGFYRAEHLSVDREYTSSPYTAAQLVATGKGDICAATFESILVGYDKGLRLTGFLSRASRYTYAIGVLAGSPIRTLADFKGTTIGVPTLNSGALQASDSMLIGAGLARTDYTYTPIGLNAQALDALVTKRVAGISSPYGAILPFEILGYPMRVFRHPTLGSISNAAYFATPATLAAKADQLRRFTRAIVEAAIFVRENPQVAARDFLQVTNQSVTPDTLRKQTRLIQLSADDLLGADPLSDRIGAIAPRDMDLLIGFLADSGQIKTRIPAADTMTNGFVAYANAFDHAAIVRLAKSTR